MAELKIRQARKIVVTSGPRLGQLETLVVYTVDNGELHMLTLAKVDPPEAEVLAAVKADYEKRTKLIGKSVSA